jgi:predicted RNA-binding Zn-ribbon protein involved in translation (DUF1610 family)
MNKRIQTIGKCDNCQSFINIISTNVRELCPVCGARIKTFASERLLKLAFGNDEDSELHNIDLLDELNTCIFHEEAFLDTKKRIVLNQVEQMLPEITRFIKEKSKNAILSSAIDNIITNEKSYYTARLLICAICSELVTKYRPKTLHEPNELLNLYARIELM